mmetsp:Transcript_61858/g.124016  ORF Transcript_61858/g.124016 Transcript_61858/m.124016 type:complete len:89 (+) Transcript_61858:952-1218(+)
MKRAAAREKAAAREEVVAREEVAAMGRAAARVFNAMSTVRVRLEPRKGNLRKVDNISASYVIFFCTHNICVSAFQVSSPLEQGPVVKA